MPKAPAGRFVLVILFCFAQLLRSKAVTHDSQSQIAGTWRGNSKCVLKNSPCHDEINVYRFSEITGRSGWFSGSGSKVVDGKEIAMGTLEWHYNAERHTLESANSGGTFRLIVQGNKIEGSLTLPDNTEYRHIHLEKDNR